MKETAKPYLRILALTVLAFFLIAFSLYLISSLMSTTPINAQAEYAYVPNGRSGNISVINLTTNTIEYSVNVGVDPEGVAISPDGTRVYVTNSYLNNVSIIDTSTNDVIAKVPVGVNPMGVAVSPDGKKVYVANEFSNNISIIDTGTNKVKDWKDVQAYPIGVAVSIDGKAYVANSRSGTVSVIDTINDTVFHVDVGINPYGVAVTPNGEKVYVTHDESDNVSVIYTVNNTVKAVKVDPSISTARSMVKVALSPHGVVVNTKGTKAYVTNHKSPLKGASATPIGSVSIIDTANDTITKIVNVEKCPCGIAVDKEGTRVYVANSASNTVSVIDSATNSVIKNVEVGEMPSAFGQFIVSPPRVPEKNVIREFTYQVIKSVNENMIVIKINEVIDGVQGFILGIFSSVIVSFITPIVRKILEPTVITAKKIFKKK